MSECWWCSGDLVWKQDFDAADYLCNDEREGICTQLDCLKCGATVIYLPPEDEELE